MKEVHPYNRSVQPSNVVSSDAILIQQNRNMRVFRQSDIIPTHKTRKDEDEYNYSSI